MKRKQEEEEEEESKRPKRKREDRVAQKGIFITNIVSVSKCDHAFVLQDVVLGLKGKFGSVFPAVVSSNRNNHTSFNIFRTGSCINTGSKSKANSILSMILLESYLSRLYHQYTRLGRWKIINIVASMNLGYRISMDKINIWYSHINGPVRDGVFEGFSIKIEDLHVSFTVFVKGQVNCTGLHSLEQIPIVEERAHLLFWKCRQEEGEEEEE